MKLLGENHQFANWMNRPLARVQVYSFRLYLRLFPEFKGSFRVLPAYRKYFGVIDHRLTVARAIKLARKNRAAIVLPHYVEKSGNYEPVME